MTEAITSFSGKYRFLSNFWYSNIRPLGSSYTFPTVEHAYQCAKAVKKEDFLAIYNAKTPGQTKKIARTVELRPNWDEIKFKVMKIFVEIKFEQNPDLAQKLLNTGDAELVEGNTWGDVYWGVCKGVGENNLGKILMEVREKLKNGTIQFKPTHRIKSTGELVKYLFTDVAYHDGMPIDHVIVCLTGEEKRLDYWEDNLEKL